MALSGTSGVTEKRFEINEIFTPSTPVTTAELFAGRSSQMLRALDAIAERGRHVLLYGERGVGKTSLAQIIPLLVPRRRARLHFNDAVLWLAIIVGVVVNDDGDLVVRIVMALLRHDDLVMSRFFVRRQLSLRHMPSTVCFPLSIWDRSDGCDSRVKRDQRLLHSN